MTFLPFEFHFSLIQIQSGILAVYPPRIERCLKIGAPQGTWFSSHFFPSDLLSCEYRLYNWQVHEKISTCVAGYKSHHKSTGCNNEKMLRRHFSISICYLGRDVPWLKACMNASNNLLALECSHTEKSLQFLFLVQMKCGLGPSGNFFIQNNWSLERKMQLITMPVATIPLAKKALIWCLIVSVSW